MDAEFACMVSAHVALPLIFVLLGVCGWWYSSRKQGSGIVSTKVYDGSISFSWPQKRKKKVRRRPSSLALARNASSAAAWRLLLESHPLLGGTSGGICQSDKQSQGYGEPSEDAMASLAAAWPMGTDCALTPGSKLYDLGSGFGRLAMGVYLHSKHVSVTGVEVNPCRAAASKRYAAQLRRALKGGPDVSSLGKLRFFSGDVLRHSIRDATHIFASGQVWPPELLKAVLGGNLTRSAPRLRCIGLLSQIKPHHWNADIEASANAWGRVVGVHHLPTSWLGAQVIFLQRGPCSAAERPQSGTGQRQTWWNWFSQPSKGATRMLPVATPPPPPKCQVMSDGIAEAEEWQKRARVDDALSGIADRKLWNGMIWGGDYSEDEGEM